MKKEKAIVGVVVFCCLMSVIVKFGIYAALIVAVFLTVRLMQWRE